MHRGGNTRLHVHGASAVEMPLYNISTEWRGIPSSFIINRNRVHMGVEQNRLFATPYPPQDISHGIDNHFIIAKRFHLLLDELNNFLFLPGYAFYSYQALRKLNQLLTDFWRDQI